MEGLLLVAALLGLIPAKIAESKGYRFGVWWLYGSLLFIVALPHSMFLPREAGELEKERLASGKSRKCPFCAELIKAEATVCRFCSRDVPVLILSATEGPVASEEPVRQYHPLLWLLATLLPILAIGLGYWYMQSMTHTF
jgi:hypothetical protein